jgi:hypothetical protein
MTSQTVTMYFDEYEALNGDGRGDDGVCGMFPQLNMGNEEDIKISVRFELRDKYWVQMNGMRINNLDGDCGFNLLLLLNKNSNSNGIGIKNRDLQILKINLKRITDLLG